ncbi:MAG: hypothetical protein HQ596_05825 [Candidatus Saganbacteria bacterium]|nr:hypothetical protein [Candidatus Saganbacteria bacterium]
MSRPIEMFDAQFNQLERAMDISTRWQEVISHNIANAKTPGFTALTFDEHLMRAVERSDKKDVILEDELAALADNSIKYSSYIKLLSSKINVLKNITSQGRR